MEVCKQELKLRYMAQGVIRVPIPAGEELPEDLKDKRLWMKKPFDDPKTAIKSVTVIGKWPMPPSVLQEKVDPPHLVFEYRVDLVDPNGAFRSVPVQPWLFELLAKHTLEIQEKEKEE